MGHHYVPRWLLRKFEDPSKPGFVWQHDKQKLTSVQASISQVAQERGYYDELTETRLNNEVERPGSKAIQSIIDGQSLDSQLLFDLIYYIAVMIRRVPFHRKWAAEIARSNLPQSLEQSRANGYAHFQRLAAQDGFDQIWIDARSAEIDAVIEKLRIKPPVELFEQINNPFPSELMIKTLLQMTWRVLENDGPQLFLTTDNPVFFARDKGYALGGLEAEVNFPLSTRISLHGSYAFDRRNFFRLQVRQRTVRELNRRLISQASRFVFTHDRSPWIGKLLPLKDVAWMRIGW